MKEKKSYLSDLKKVFSDYEEHESAVEDAVDFAIKAHDGQVRKYDKTPFVTHPMAVSLALAKTYNDIELILAGILHDTVEDCPEVGIEGIYDRFGDSVGFLVEAVTEEPLYFVEDPELVYNDKIEKILAGGITDVRVLLLKIADRDHNLSTLEGLKPNKQIRMTFETQAIYEPLRAILDNKEKSIEKSAKQFGDYLEQFELADVSALKHNLFNQTFHNFDNDIYLAAYNNTDAIVWQSDDREWFEKLVSSEKFGDHAEIVSLWTDGEEFSARFIFTKGAIFEANTDNKFKLFNFLSAF